MRQKSDTEVFQVYDRAAGTFRRAVSIEHEQLTVGWPSSILTAGKTVPLTIQFDASGRTVQPDLHVWLRPLGSVKFQRLPVSNGTVAVPARHALGLYQVRVGSGLEGLRSEYQIDTVIEIRPENAVGSISIMTPLNRHHYQRGEIIPVSIRCRTKEPATRPESIEIQLVDDAGKVHYRQNITLNTPADQPQVWQLPPAVTAPLSPRRVPTDGDACGLDDCGPVLVIRGETRSCGEIAVLSNSPWRLPDGLSGSHLFNAPERITQHLNHTGKLSENLMVDRLGHGGSGGLGEVSTTLRDADLLGPVAGRSNRGRS